MKRKYVIGTVIIILLIVGGFLLYWGNRDDSSTTTNRNKPNNQSSDETVETNTVTMKNSAFSPSNITVRPGTTVTWRNNDIVTHNVKFDAFGSSDLKPGETYTYTFDTAGTYKYICNIHPSMTGSITVE